MRESMNPIQTWAGKPSVLFRFLFSFLQSANPFPGAGGGHAGGRKPIRGCYSAGLQSTMFTKWRLKTHTEDRERDSLPAWTPPVLANRLPRHGPPTRRSIEVNSSAADT